MPQPTKPASMSLSEWRLWCCCYPNVTPPTSEHVSLEEFDPGNRLSMSRAFERRSSTPLPPGTPKNSNDSTPPARRAETLSQPHRSEKSKPKTEDRSGQRPATVLLPNPPPRPSEPWESKLVKGEQSKPQIVRQDSEHWWQAGRRMLEKKEREESRGQGSKERK